MRKVLHIKHFVLRSFLISLACISASAQETPSLTYDRIQLAESFLNAMYPDLGTPKLITVQTGFALVGSSYFYVGITLCRIGSGIPIPGNTLLPQHCPAPMQADASSYFMASIELGDKRPYLRGYGAGGKFLDEKLTVWRREIVKHPEWRESEMLQALSPMKPRFGPNNKDVFAHTIPAQAIERFSECRLNPGTAVFIAKRLLPAPDTDMQLGWTVFGEDRHKRGCSADFEPFEGRLLRLSVR